LHCPKAASGSGGQLVRREIIARKACAVDVAGEGFVQHSISIETVQDDAVHSLKRQPTALRRRMIRSFVLAHCSPLGACGVNSGSRNVARE
jgi:hypothetical protein